MTTEDQIVALFAEANPVPSLDVFDPIEPFAVSHLTTRSERSSAMTGTTTDTTRVKPSIRWTRSALAVAVVVIAAVAVATLINRDSRVAAVPLPSTGSLEPGTYYIPAGSVTPGRFSFTVPAGWATEEAFVTKNLEGEPIIANSGGNNVLLVTWIVTHVFADVCNWEGSMVDVAGSVGRFTVPTVDQLTNALLTQEGRVASGPTDVNLGGFPAKRIELIVPADLDAATCDSGFIRFWPDPGGDQSGGLCCAPAGSTDVVYVVDFDGSTFAVVARYTAASSAQDRAELEDIVSSIRVDPPGSSSPTSP